MLKKIGLSLILGLMVLALVVVPVSASHSWGNYHWARTTSPFTLQLGDNLSAAWDPYLSTTSTDWTASSVLDTTVVHGKTTGKRCRPTAGQVEVCNAAYGRNGWLGIASVWASGDHITQGTVKLNDSYFKSAPYNTPAWKNLVMCQEVGHTFGLDHQDEDFNNANLGSCMDYTNDPEANQHPNQHDFDQLETIYSHLDSTTSVGQRMSTAQAVQAGEPGDWGRLVRKQGRTAIFERDLGNGHKLFTFVIYA
jgi:hypothetical protein